MSKSVFDQNLASDAFPEFVREAYSRLGQWGATFSDSLSDLDAAELKLALLNLRHESIIWLQSRDEETARKQIESQRVHCERTLFEKRQQLQELQAKISKLERDVSKLEEDCPAAPNENGPNRDEAVVLRAVLTRLRLLAPNEDLPMPERVFSGVAGKSRVFLFFLGDPYGGRRIITKFDLPERAAKEWDVIRTLRYRNVPHETILPHVRNEPDDGVIVYPVAGDHSLKSFLDFGSYLRQTIRVDDSPSNGVRGLRMALEPLKYFYDVEPGRISCRNSTALLVWKQFFPEMPDKSSLIWAAKKALPEVDWEAPTVPMLPGGSHAPNPLHNFESLLGAETRDVRLSRIHGDLNLTNILLCPDSDQTPRKVNIIDLALSQPDQPSAKDLVQLEVAFWSEVFLPVSSNDGVSEDEAINDYCLLMDFLDGRRKELPAVVSRAAYGVAKLVYQLRRWAARVLCPGPHLSYLLEDYYWCLYFWHLNTLRFSLAPTPFHSSQVRLRLVGAALALRCIEQRIAGRYSLRAKMRLLSPTREIEEFERLGGM